MKTGFPSTSPISIILVITLNGFHFFPAKAQNPVANFIAPASGCLNQNVEYKNTSVNAATYVWDFSFKDLNSPSATQLATSVPGHNIPTGITLIFDTDSWYGFLMNRDGNNIFRFDFGDDLENVPTITDLGNINGMLSGPQNLEFVREGGIYYGILTNFLGGNLIRLNFLSGPGAAPTAQDLGGAITHPRGLDIVNDSGNYIAAVASFSGNKITLINFGNSITNNPISGDQTDVLSGQIDSPIGVRLMKDGANWYGFVASFGANMINRLDFGATLFSTVTISSFYSLPSPTEIAVQLEGDQYHLFSVTASGQVHHVNLGTSLSGSPSSQILGNFGLLNNTFAFDLVRSSPGWYGFTADYSTGNVYRIKFKSNNVVGVSVDSSTKQNPDPVNYSIGGNYFVELTASSALGANVLLKSLAIQNLPSPDITISSDNLCFGGTTTLVATEQTGMTLNSWAWDFGDSQTSSLPSPSHSYAVGQYNITLDAVAANGCSNHVIKPISIFNPPVPAFTLPTASPVCTNQLYTFINASSFDPGSNPTWQWQVNGTNVATTRDLQQSFANTASQQITLLATIPGCSPQQGQSFLVQQQGPTVDFTVPTGCQGKPLLFTNNSTGAISGYAWDFGDGNTSVLDNPQNAYPSIGNYTASLSATSSSGCNNSATKQVTIHTTPLSDFTLDLPPFSCSGSPSQFNDITPNPTDSNLSSWAWSFGDGANGSSTQHNPLYTYDTAGLYSVGLTVTTNFGCSAFIQKPITIAPSPTAAFTHTPACVNEGTQFTDTSTGSIKSRLWKIDNSTYTVPNPLQVFGAQGTYSARLTVTGNNNCVAQMTQMISVPVVQSPAFTAQGTCATKPAVFLDTTPFSSDPVTSVSWNFGGQGSGTGSPAQFTFPATGNFSVKMDALVQSGCIYSVTKTIAVVSPPVAGFTTSIDAGPVPLLVQFTNISTNASGYLWHFHDNTNSTSAGPSLSFTFNELGEYIVDLDATSVQGCIDTFSKIISAVIPRVDAGVTGLQFIQDPASGEYRALFAIGNDGNLPLTNPTILVEMAGKVTLKEKLNLTVLPSQRTSQILNFSLLPRGLDYLCLSVEADQDVSAYNNKQCVDLTNETIAFAPYPNPVNGELYLDWIAADSGIANIMIFNSTGAQAFNRSVQASAAGLNQIRLDVSNLSPGLYVLVLNYSRQKKTFRFAIQ